MSGQMDRTAKAHASQTGGRDRCGSHKMTLRTDRVTHGMADEAQGDESWGTQKGEEEKGNMDHGTGG
jgi:hypothetical protein